MNPQIPMCNPFRALFWVFLGRAQKMTTIVKAPVEPPAVPWPKKSIK